MMVFQIHLRRSLVRMEFTALQVIHTYLFVCR